MTEQTGDIGLERQSLPLLQRLTWARAVLTQSIAELVSPEQKPKGPTRFYVELGGNSLSIRAVGDPDSLPADEEGLEIVASLVEDGAADLVLADESCIDLSFRLPPGPLSEVRGMIASEISFKSPFSEEATLSFWEAREADDGGWWVRAAITLKDRVLNVAETMQQADLTVNALVREHAGGELRAVPPWAEPSTKPGPPALAAFRNLGATARAAFLGAGVFLLSSALLWGQVTLRDWSLADEADAARATLSAGAQASARMRGLESAIAQSTEVLALTGTMS
ncbi:MAG: hypothetical protein AAGJ74_15650, partial [Pseudomonadota bacterium]